jgi:hypothetical protein
MGMGCGVQVRRSATYFTYEFFRFVGKTLTLFAGFKDPPKPISDVVESILGAVHVDGGFAAGQKATLHLMNSVFQVIEKAAKESGVGVLDKVMKHPKKLLQEISGELLEIVSCSEPKFATLYPEGRVLYRDTWRRPTNDVSCYVSFVKILGTLVVAVADESLVVSKNNVSALIAHALKANPDLIERFKICRSTVESGVHRAGTREDGKKENET